MMRQVIGYMVGNNIIGNIGSRSVSPYKTLWRIIKSYEYEIPVFDFEVARINIVPDEWLERKTFYGKPIISDDDLDEFLDDNY